MHEKAEQLERSLADATGRTRVDLLVRLGRIRGRSDAALARGLLEDALASALRNDYPAGEAAARIELGMRSTIESDLPAAESQLRRGLEIALEEDDLRKVIRARDGLADVKNLSGDFLEALEICMETLKLIEEADAEIDPSTTLNHLGHIYFRLGDNDRSLEYHQRVVEWAQASGDPERIATAFNNAGVLLRQKGCDREALAELRKSLLHARQGASRRTLSRTLSNVAFTLIKLEELPRAHAYAESALKVNRSSDNPMGDLDALRSLSSALFGLKRYDDAIAALSKALRIAETHALPLELQNCLRRLSAVYEEQGRFQEALEALKRSRDLRERLLGEEKARLFSEAEARYKSEIYQLENVRLAAANREISTQRELLEHARDEAQAADRAKSEFLAIMSHEVRTPLNGVLGMADLLKDTALSDQQQDYVETIRMSGEALLSVLNDILDFSKIEAGKLEIDEKEFDLVLALGELVTLVTSQARQKSLELITSLSGDLPARVRGDWNRLRQILLNLLGNALKFTPRGRIELEVTLAEEREEAIDVDFSVRDTGIGIDEEKQHQLFEPFVQTDRSMTRKYGGTGLGLAICRRLVEMMGGGIGVESHPGAGSRFWITVPMGRVEQLPAPPPPAGAELEGVRILIVESDPSQSATIEALVSRWCRVDRALDAAAALEALGQAAGDRDRFSAALISLRLPGTSGIELGRLIRRDERFCDLPMILMSAVVRASDVGEAGRAGFEAYLAKPLRPSRTLACIRNALELEPRAPSIDADAHPPAERRQAEVLVVEDNAVNREVSVRMIEQLGHRVEVAEDGAQALAAVERSSFDIVFMDCQMPVMDGYEATRRIRALPERSRRLPIVAMTAHAMDPDRARCLAAGMDDYISKPFTSKEIAAALAKWLAARKDDG